MYHELAQTSPRKKTNNDNDDGEKTYFFCSKVNVNKQAPKLFTLPSPYLTFLGRSATLFDDIEHSPGEICTDARSNLRELIIEFWTLVESKIYRQSIRQCQNQCTSNSLECWDPSLRQMMSWNSCCCGLEVVNVVDVDTCSVEMWVRDRLPRSILEVEKKIS